MRHGGSPFVNELALLFGQCSRSVTAVQWHAAAELGDALSPDHEVVDPVVPGSHGVRNAKLAAVMEAQLDGEAL